MGRWRDEHRPVLRAVVQVFDEQGSGPVSVSDIARVTGLDEQTVRRALNALDQSIPTFFTGLDRRLPGIAGVNAPTTAARQAIGWKVSGAWPDPARRALAISTLSLAVAVLSLILRFV